MRTDAPLPTSPFELQEAFELTAEESRSFLRVVAQGASIQRHYDLHLWLGGELQRFLPHETLLSAWGDFSAWKLRLDVVSHLPGPRAHPAPLCSEEILRRAHLHWLGAGRQPVELAPAHLSGPASACTCSLHAAWRRARAIFVHAVRDQRSGNDSLYAALSSAGLADRRGRGRFHSLAHLLFGQIDIACRRFAPLPLEGALFAAAVSAHERDLSSREQEILDCIRQGKTNRDIALALGISLFTVKNHTQRLFRKIGVRSRTQAAVKSNHAIGRST